MVRQSQRVMSTPKVLVKFAPGCRQSLPQLCLLPSQCLGDDGRISAFFSGNIGFLSVVRRRKVSPGGAKGPPKGMD